MVSLRRTARGLRSGHDQFLDRSHGNQEQLHFWLGCCRECCCELGLLVCRKGLTGRNGVECGKPCGTDGGKIVRACRTFLHQRRLLGEGGEGRVVPAPAPENYAEFG